MPNTTQDILSPRLLLLQQELQNTGKEALRLFWQEVEEQGTPLIEAGADGTCLVTFLWRDDQSARNIAVIQDWGTDGIREHHMTLLPGSDLWYLTRTMRSDTRTTYQLSPSTSSDPNDAGPYQLDPLNPKTFTAYLSESGDHIFFSLLELPDAPAMPWRYESVSARGIVELHTPFADQRRLWLYRPPGAHTTPLPLLVVFDGRLYKEMLGLPEMLDYLIGIGQIAPVTALMVDNPDRSELQCQPNFAVFIAEKVLPWLQSVAPITDDPSQRIILGSSLGGLAATYLGYRYPHLFGSVFAQSGWFRWRPEGDPEHHWLARQLASAPTLPLRFLLQVGNLEIAKMADGGPSQLQANRYMRDVLDAKGYAVSYQEYSGGHDSSSLETPLAAGLVALLG